jgi:hypothetical protein
MKMTAFWDIASCSLEVDRRFRGAYCLHLYVIFEVLISVKFWIVVFWVMRYVFL